MENTILINSIQELNTLVSDINNKTENYINPNNFIEIDGLSKFKSILLDAFDYNPTPLQTATLDLFSENTNNIQADLTEEKKVFFNNIYNLPESYKKSIKNALLTSYFTPKEIIKHSNNAILNYFDKNQVVDNITILEPSAGNGKFLLNLENYTKNNSKNFKIDAVEKDKLTHTILESNFKNNAAVNTVHTAFENFSPKEKYNLVIGNVPFGNFNVFDKELHNKYQHLYKGHIHNYFFVKSTLLTKPGGIISIITTASMLDNKSNQDFRTFLIQNNNLISVKRFHNKTFSKSKTSVISDLIILQKSDTLKLEENFTLNEKLFIESETITLDFKGNPTDFSINSYVANNSDAIDGDIKTTTGIAGRPVLTIQPNEKSYNQNNELIFPNLDDLALEIEQNAYTQPKIKELFELDTSTLTEEIEDEALILSKTLQEKFIDTNKATLGNIVLHNNEIYRLTKNTEFNKYLALHKLSYNSSEKEILLNIIIIRNNYTNLLSAVRNTNENDIETYQKALNTEYDLFNFKYGPLNRTSNTKLILKDFQYDLLFGLENKNDKGIFEKADIFKEEFFKKTLVQTNKEYSLKDAILQSLNNKGNIDVPYIDSLLPNDNIDNWIQDALDRELLFINMGFDTKSKPSSYYLTNKSNFISGYIDLKIAYFSNNNFPGIDPFFSKFLSHRTINKAVANLQEVKPYKLSIQEIDPSLGETWIPSAVYLQFAKDHFKTDNCTLTFQPSFDTFDTFIGHSNFAHTNYFVNKDRGSISPSKVFKYALEQTSPLFTKKISVGDKDISVIDRKTINAVNFNIEKLNNAFKSWIFQHKELAIKLENNYHHIYNSNVKEKYNGEHLNLQNLQGYEPYQHQKDATWQLVVQNGGILDHEVGFGKTLTMAMSVMKRKELGICNKQMVACLNANYMDVFLDFKEAFPNGKFLLVKPADVSPDKVQETFFRIANNHWDAIVIAHSSLLKLPPAPEALLKINQETVLEVQSIMADEESYNTLGRREKNILEKKLANAEAKLLSAQWIIDNKKEKGILTFEDLKIDHLVIDESQFFKNLGFNTRHTRVSGLGSTQDVQKTMNLLTYIRSIQSKHGKDAGITLASGTVISNSLSELYNVFRYLRPNHLDQMGINSFDQWARTFTRKTSEYEESVSGTVKLKERFRFFVKVPELSKLYNDIANFADQNTFPIDRPESNIELVTIAPYKEQLDYFNAIKKFGETKDVTLLINVADNDNNKKAAGLICTDQGKKASLDMRLISPDFGDHPENKINTMIRKAMPLYEKTTENKGTQLIFCDKGTPTSKVSFNLYQAIKDNLIEQGIPENEIRFIHDGSTQHRKKELFKLVNQGAVRFLIGSTDKMGVGVNVQKRICAIHHLDFPWRPTDLTQRNGRGVRKGNWLIKKMTEEFKNTLPIYFYAKKSSLDSYIFNSLLNKDRFLTQFKTASIATRTLDEGVMKNDGNFNLEQYMTAISENPLLSEKMKLDRQLNQITDRYAAYKQIHYQNKSSLSFVNSQIETYSKNVSDFKKDLTSVLPFLKKQATTYQTTISKEQQKATPFDITFNNTNYKNAATFGKILKKKLELLSNDRNNKLNGKFKFGSFFNDEFKIHITKIDFSENAFNNNYKILIETPSKKTIGFKNNILVKDDFVAGFYLFNALNRVSNILQNQKDSLEEMQDKKVVLENNMENKFDQHSKMMELKTKIKEITFLINKKDEKEIENSQENNQKDIDPKDALKENQETLNKNNNKPKR